MFSRKSSEGSGRSLRSLSLRLGEDVLELIQDELHNLALEHHVDRHVGRLCQRAEQGGAKHDGEALNRHPVGILVLNDPGDRTKTTTLLPPSQNQRIYPSDPLALSSYHCSGTVFGLKANVAQAVV